MEEKKSTFRYIVRVANTDLDGNKKIGNALKKIKGVGFSLSNAVCGLAEISQNTKTGELTEADSEKLTGVLKQIQKDLPTWMLNRRRDPESGLDKHLLSADIEFNKEMDIRTMKKIKSYRGMRHAFGLPTRGQRTKSNFRRNKGKGLGVMKSKAAQSKKA